MKSNEKRLILILIIILAIVVCIKIKLGKKENINPNVEKPVSVSKNETEDNVIILEDGTKLNKSKALLKERVFNGLKLTNIRLEKLTDGTTMFSANVENTTSTDLTGVTINLLDNDGNVLTTLDGLIAKTSQAYR